MSRSPVFQRPRGRGTRAATAARVLLVCLAVAAVLLAAFGPRPSHAQEGSRHLEEVAAGVGAGGAGEAPGRAPETQAEGRGQRSVLVLGSYEVGSLSSVQQITAITDAIRLAFPRIGPQIDYLVPPELRGQGESAEFRERLGQSLRARYAGRRPDLLVVVDTLAFRVLTEETPELFPGVPVVFSGVVREKIEPEAAGVRPATGVFEQIDAAGTLDLMTQLHPGLRRVLVVSQGSELAAIFRSTAEAQLAPYRPGLRIDWASSTTLEQLKHEVDGLGSDSAVLLLSFANPDAPGEHIELLRGPWTTPLYTVAANHINQNDDLFGDESQGAIGGRVVSYPLMGQAAGDLAVRVLRGADPRTIPVQEHGGLVTMVDDRQIRRLGIAPASVPKGATVVNRPRAFASGTWTYILAVAAVIAIQGAIIALLIISRARLRRVQAALDLERNRYKLAVSSATEGVWDWDIGRNETVWSGPLAERLGFGGTRSPDRPADRVWAMCLHPVDRERVQRAIDRHLAEDAPYDVEYRLCSLDGRYRWYASRGRCRRDERGRPLRMTGTMTDVNDRVEAELLRDHQNAVLELIASDTPIESILRQIVLGVQKHDATTIASVLLLDADGRTMRPGAAPDLPAEYLAAIDGLRIGPRMGSCGTAMHRRERVIVADIAADPLWVECGHLALKHGLRACWSEPILGGRGDVFGALAMYHREARSPSEWELQLISSSARLAGLAIERRRLERDHRDAEARFRTLFQQSAVGLVQTSPEGRIMMANGRACEIFGRLPEDVLGRTAADLTHPEDAALHLDLRRQALESGEGYRVEKRYLRPDGTVVWADVGVRVVRGPDGRVEHLIAGIQDVTARKEAERELERFFSLSPGLLCVTQGGRFKRVNPALARALGRTEEELCSRPYLDLVHPDDVEATRAQRDRIVEGAEALNFVNRYRHADGSYRWLSWSTSRITPDGLVYAAARDVTEERLAAEALRKSESKYRHIIETAQEGVWLVDAEWKTTLVNARMAGMLGLRAQDMLGRHILDFCDQEARAEALRNMQDREAGRAAQHDFRLRHADGHDVWTLMSTNAITDDDGQFIGALAMVTDITARRKADQALRESEATNRALLAAMPDLLFRVDAQGRYLSFSGPADIPLLVPPDRFMGRTMREVLPGHIAELGQKALADALGTGHVQVYEYQTVRADRPRWWEVRVVPTGKREALFLVRDVTQRRDTEEALRESQKRLSQLVTQAPIGIIVWNTRFEIQQWNPTAQRIFGYAPQEVVGRHGEIIVPPEVRPAVAEVWRDLMAQRGGTYSVNENLTRSGDRIICEWHNTPLTAADGSITSVSSFVQDVTERVMSERRQALMMQELDHRVKNNMAAVLSLAEQTGRATANFEEFQSTFMGRVRALARMHTVLAASRWRGADLRSLIRQTVEPYSGPGRLDADGPAVSLSPRAAQAMAMTLNELATNASKYGSLSSPAGKVTLRWTLELPAGIDAPTLRIDWQERSGPAVTPPRRRGLGIDLIEGAIVYQLTGKVEFRFPPEGLECSVAVSLVSEDKAPGHAAVGAVR